MTQAAAIASESQERTPFLLIQPEDVASYWQPQPANGHASVIVSPAIVRMDGRFSVGLQTLPPGGVVREHSHEDNEEVLHFTAGTGVAYINGVEHQLSKGQTLYLGKHCKHRFVNNGSEELSWVWFFTPNGLEDFFRDIGRVRHYREAAPENFDRPADVAQIEARTVFSQK